MSWRRPPLRSNIWTAVWEGVEASTKSDLASNRDSCRACPMSLNCRQRKLELWLRDEAALMEINTIIHDEDATALYDDQVVRVVMAS